MNPMVTKPPSSYTWVLPFRANSANKHQKTERNPPWLLSHTQLGFLEELAAEHTTYSMLRGYMDD